MQLECYRQVILASKYILFYKHYMDTENCKTGACSNR